ncbi:hypothetical protein K440DRAFT_637281 [Wilcoxina mikolae CBS 423.85]|nr:hypothetical protein K440DRAFT_637281 [Wilcoxina mikolae CBS 423.85]
MTTLPSELLLVVNACAEPVPTSWHAHKRFKLKSCKQCFAIPRPNDIVDLISRSLHTLGLVWGPCPVYPVYVYNPMPMLDDPYALVLWDPVVSTLLRSSDVKYIYVMRYYDTNGRDTVALMFSGQEIVDTICALKDPTPSGPRILTLSEKKVPMTTTESDCEVLSGSTSPDKLRRCIKGRNGKSPTYHGQWQCNRHVDDKGKEVCECMEKKRREGGGEARWKRRKAGVGEICGLGKSEGRYTSSIITNPPATDTPPTSTMTAIHFSFFFLVNAEVELPTPVFQMWICGIVLLRGRRWLLAALEFERAIIIVKS